MVMTKGCRIYVKNNRKKRSKINFRINYFIHNKVLR
jgi:hypothetical protein